MRTLIGSVVLALVLSTGCAAHQPPVEPTTAYVLAPTDARVTDAWTTALKMAKIKENWSPPASIVVMPFSHPDVWGQTFLYTTIDGLGIAHNNDQVIAYCPSRMGKTLLHNVLVHEFLHCIHARLKVIDPKLREIEDEAYVCGLGACPIDPRIVTIQPKGD